MRERIKKLVKKPIKAAFFTSTWILIILLIYIEVLKSIFIKEQV